MNFIDNEIPRGVYEIEGTISILKTIYFTIIEDFINMNAD